MSTSGGYVPSPADRAWVESAAAPIHPTLAAIEAAAEPESIPILDREAGRVLSAIVAGRRQIVEVGTAYGYSTLCLALGAAPDATIATIDPDRGRTDLARGWWRQAGIADERIVVVNRPALEAFAARTSRPWSGRSTSRSSMRSSRSTRRISTRSSRGSCRGAGHRRQRPVVRRGVGRPSRSSRWLDRGPARLRPGGPPRPALHRHDPAGRRRAARRVVPRLTTMRLRVRLFAIQRELAGTREVALELAEGATIEDGWTALVERFPVLAPGRPSVRFARNGEYADPDTVLADGDELACIPPVSGGSDPDGPTARVIQLRSSAFPAGLGEELGARLATPADGAVVVFAGRTRESPGTPAPGQEAEAARHAGRHVEALEYEAHESMAEAILNQIADEVEARFGVVRLAIVHRIGPVPLGEVSILVVAAAPHRDAAFDAARYAIDETKARAPIWKAERFTDGHVWIGAPARTTAERTATGPTAAEPPRRGEGS